MKKKPSVLIIYTGGTIGMMRDPATGALHPFHFTALEEFVPELKRLEYDFSLISFDPAIDSSEMNHYTWAKIASIIYENYHHYDGFVVLHGTDTMAYTGSALSFMLENLQKPVILTGSQLPIGMIRTDGKENFITAVEIAVAKKNGRPIVPEVCILFENKLYRANRTIKQNAEFFNAFRSYNYPALAEANINIMYNYDAIHQTYRKIKLNLYTEVDSNVVILKLFPGINQYAVEAILNIDGLRAVVLETYGTGNCMTDSWFLNQLKYAIRRGIIILNVTQCVAGSVDMGRYESSLLLRKLNVLNGYDLTTEAAVTKLMVLLGRELKEEELFKYLKTSVAGEMTIK